MIDVQTFETPELLIADVVELLRKTLASPGALMLSGGSTPYAAYNRITAAPSTVHPERRIFLSDERMVPFDAPQSNGGKLAAMLHALRCEDRFIPVDTSLSPEAAARRFARELDPLDPVDLGLLGMGTDGHTAGFFTREQARLTNGPLTLHTQRPDGLNGVSVTPSLIHRVERIILLVAGESKRAVIDTLLNAPETIPAGIALANHPQTELWTDIADPGL